MKKCKKVKYTGVLDQPVVCTTLGSGLLTGVLLTRIENNVARKWWKDTKHREAGHSKHTGPSPAEHPIEGYLSAYDEKYSAQFSAQFQERYLALFKHYGIERTQPHAEANLIWALARDHVPGCRMVYEPPKRKGPHSIWTECKNLELLADVWTLTRKDQSARRACNILATSPKYEQRYRGRRGARIPLDTLYRRYQYALKDEVVSKIIMGVKTNGAPAKDWVIGNSALDENERKTAGARWVAFLAKHGGF